jgi:hypothetical protein
MKARLLLSILIIGTIIVGACSSSTPTSPALQGIQPLNPSSALPEATSSPTMIHAQNVTPTTLQTPSLTPPGTTSPSTPAIPTSMPATTSTPSSTPTGPYTGPLFDTHLHLSSTYVTGQLSRLTSAQSLLKYLDRGGVNWAIGFFTLPPARSRASWVTAAETIIRDTKTRIIPLISPYQDGQFAAGQYSEAALQQYLQPQGLLQGVGEIVLTDQNYQTVTFDGSAMQTVFKAVNGMKGIVMIHPSALYANARPTELAEIEPSIQKYPDVIFLFHPNYNFDLVAPLMSKYPNVYYSWDFAGSFYQGPRGGTTQFPTLGSSLFTTDPNSANAESFLAVVNRTGLDRIVEETFKRLAPQLQKYPNRIMWGTDFASPWHFDDAVTDLAIKITREVIGRLPTDVQEKYAYQNALNVFGRFLTTNP